MIYDEAHNKATVFEAGYSEPAAIPPPLEVKVEDLLLRRTTSYDRAEEKVILKVLAATETPPVPASIQTQLRMLDDVEGNLGAASALTAELIDFASNRAGLFRSGGNSRDQVVQRKVQRARTQAGGDRCGGRGDERLLKERPAPLREEGFPILQWAQAKLPELPERLERDGDKGQLPVDHELQELKRCSPKAVQPDIKNLKTLTALWDFLNL